MVAVLSGNNWGSDVRVAGFDNDSPDIDRNSRYNEVGVDYFATMGIPLLAGREFALSDGPEDAPVAIINETFARKFNLDPREAVGTFMRSGGPGELDTEIVGVVQDAKYSEVKQDVPPLFFRPHAQNTGLGFLTFYIRTGGDAAPVLQAIPEVVRGLAPNLPVDRLLRVEEVAKQNVFMDRTISTMASAFAILATILAAVGLYGVLAYTVSQRTREIGLRMALGAGAPRIRGMVVRQITTMLVIGGVIGAAASIGLGSLAESLLFGVTGMDVAVLVLAVGLVGLVAYGAGYLPARRASRVDPMEALRYE